MSSRDELEQALAKALAGSHGPGTIIDAVLAVLDQQGWVSPDVHALQIRAWEAKVASLPDPSAAEPSSPESPLGLCDDALGGEWSIHNGLHRQFRGCSHWRQMEPPVGTASLLGTPQAEWVKGIRSDAYAGFGMNPAITLRLCDIALVALREATLYEPIGEAFAPGPGHGPEQVTLNPDVHLVDRETIYRRVTTDACPECNGVGWTSPVVGNNPGNRVACLFCKTTGRVTTDEGGEG